MKRIIMAAGMILYLLACTDGNEVPGPSITAFTPMLVPAGGTVKIVGAHFSGAQEVAFGGAPAASFTVVSDSTITAVVGAGSTGPVTVRTPAGSTSLPGFVLHSSISACQLSEFSGRPDIGLGFPKKPGRLRTTGNVKIAVIFVDFSDQPADASTEDALESFSPYAENYLNAVSYQKLTVQFVPTYKWFRMTNPSTAYGWPAPSTSQFSDFIREAIGIADPTVNFRGSDAFVIVPFAAATVFSRARAFVAVPPAAIMADGIDFYNGAVAIAPTVRAGATFAHEIGHMLGLVDLYGFSGLPARYSGEFSTMGTGQGKAEELFAWERWSLGWVDELTVLCQPSRSSGVIRLWPVETSHGTKMLVVPVSITSAIVVESRRRLGFDNKLAKTGSLVYLVDTSVPSGNGTIKVLPFDETNQSKQTNILEEGESVSYQNVMIKLISKGEGFDDVLYVVD